MSWTLDNAKYVREKVKEEHTPDKIKGREIHLAVGCPAALSLFCIYEALHRPTRYLLLLFIFLIRILLFFRR